MKLSPGRALIHSALIAHVFAREAHIQFLRHDAPQAPPGIKSASIAPVAARILLAERLGLSQFHPSSALLDQDVVDLNNFNAQSSTIFQDSSELDRRKALIVLEGVESEHDIRKNSFEEVLTIPEVPSQEESTTLWNELLQQSGLAARRDKNSGPPHAGLSHLESHRSVVALQELGLENIQSEGRLIFATYHESLPSTHEAQKSRTKQKIVGQLPKWSRQHEIDLILVTMPDSIQQKSISKRSSATWGSYVKIPRAKEESKELEAAPVPPRPTVDDDKSSFSSADTSITKTSSSSTPSTSSASKTSTASGNYTGPTTPPRGILPACFSSLRSCQETTHDCSGHGSCELQYSYLDETQEKRTVYCYACTCKRDVKTNKDGGKKTTIWTGPACQKQDFTAPFWLLAGFTIALVSIIAWSVGLLYSMGSEELPSVIGAGVAGPRAK